MSVLEFIASIKWPVTVLLLAALSTVVLRGSPGTRRSMGEWLGQRNLRFSLGGQEIEATLAETQGRLGTAAEPDSQLVGGSSATDTASDQQGSDASASQSVEASRRAAVEDLLRSAALLGWQLARKGTSSPPDPTVRWEADGRPVIESESVTHELSAMPSDATQTRRRPAIPSFGGRVSETVFHGTANLTYYINGAGDEVVEDVLDRLPMKVRQREDDNLANTDQGPESRA
ncbi:hypothetical protein [Streptomyces sp. NPDC005141]